MNIEEMQKSFFLSHFSQPYILHPKENIFEKIKKDYKFCKKKVYNKNIQSYNNSSKIKQAPKVILSTYNKNIQSYNNSSKTKQAPKVILSTYHQSPSFSSKPIPRGSSH
jgi:hypothetical protein